MLTCSREVVYMSAVRGTVKIVRLNRVKYSFALDQQKTLLAATRTVKYPQVHSMLILRQPRWRRALRIGFSLDPGRSGDETRFAYRFQYKFPRFVKKNHLVLELPISTVF